MTDEELRLNALRLALDSMTFRYTSNSVTGTTTEDKSFPVIMARAERFLEYMKGKDGENVSGLTAKLRDLLCTKDPV